MLRYAFWVVLGAVAVISMFLPTEPAAKAAVPVMIADQPALTMTLSH